MIRHHISIALRNLSKHKGYAFTNIVGLAIGLAVAFLILLYIQFQLSYDSFHVKGDRLYRMSIVSSKEGNRISDSPVFVAPLGPAMREEFPEVENAARISTRRVAYLSFNDHAIKLNRILHADSSFFDLFSFTMISGDRRRALDEPFSIVLTEGTARQLFGGEDPLGKTVKLDNNGPYMVRGIVEEPPENSHIQFQALVSFSTLYHIPTMFMDWDGGNQYIAYVLLRKGISPAMVQDKLPAFMWKHMNKRYASMNLSWAAYLQPFNDIHLSYNENSKSLRTNLIVFSAIGVLILFIACANFVNLANARAISRSKEVGVRKVLGASRARLFRQFLGESFILTGIAAVVAFLLVELWSSSMARLLGIETSIFTLVTPATGFGFLALILLVGVASGFYPAVYLSSLETTKTLKGGVRGKRGKLRDGLVVLQFAISMVLIIATAVVIRQLNFIRQKDLGFIKESMLVLPLIGEEAQSKVNVLKSEFLRIPEVVAATASSDVPYAGFTSNGYFPEGFTSPMMIHVVDVDDAFLSTFGIQLLQGRNFLPASASDKEAFLINERLAHVLNWHEPLGKTITRNGVHPVIGVVKDFHFASLHETIEPLIITNRPWGDRFAELTLKLRSGDYHAALGHIEQTWEKISPSTPFAYSFLDQSIDRLYRSEQRLQLLFEWFSMIAILIAVIGLLSLASLSIEQRTKEIGVRKVLGASVAGIATLLSNRIITIVVLASAIAWPLAFLAVSRWLNNFAYRAEIGLGAFVGTALAALAIALMAVSYHTIRAALANPIDALRYE